MRRLFLAGAVIVASAAATAGEKRAVARNRAGQATGSAGSGETPRGLCGIAPSSPNTLLGPAWNGWGSDAANTRYQPNPGISATDVPQLKLKWAFGFPGGNLAYSQ